MFLVISNSWILYWRAPAPRVQSRFLEIYINTNTNTQINGLAEKHTLWLLAFLIGWGFVALGFQGNPHLTNERPERYVMQQCLLCGKDPNSLRSSMCIAFEIALGTRIQSGLVTLRCT